MILFLDSSAVVKVYLVEMQIQQVIEAVEAANEVAVSALALAEVTHAITRREQNGEISPDYAREVYRNLLERYKRLLDALKMLEITSDIYDEPLEFRAFQNLKTPDALHLATALHHACQELWANDLRLSEVTSQISFRVLP